MKRGFLLVCALGCGLADDGRDDTTVTGSTEEDSPLPDGMQPAALDNEPPGAWDCIGEAPTMAAREPGRVQYVVPVMDIATRTAVPELRVQVCSDAGCTQELPLCDGALGQCYELSIDRSPTELVFDFPFGFEGGLRFTAPGYVELNYALGGPMVGTPDGQMSVTGTPIALISAATLDQLHSSLGQPFDPQRGMLMATVLDCRGERATGVELQPLSGNDDGAVTYRLSFTNIATPGTLQTDYRGVAGLSNLLPDAFTIGVSAPGGEEYARAAVMIHPNAIALAELRVGLGVWGH